MAFTRRLDTEEARKFWESLERNHRVVAKWPDWMRRGSVGETLSREWEELPTTLIPPDEESPSGQP
ncbi:hypothetical protein ACQKGO_37200 [Corallococcus interemptor]|uniref:hypothetical protein n=1 Tax=Corallococcus interemptor TaxID=2316720 RepID=UPI003D02DA5D